MSYNPTPRTDTEWSKWCNDLIETSELGDFARTLERENNQLRDIAKRLAQDLENERDGMQSLIDYEKFIGGAK